MNNDRESSEQRLLDRAGIALSIRFNGQIKMSQREKLITVALHSKNTGDLIAYTVIEQAQVQAAIKDPLSGDQFISRLAVAIEQSIRAGNLLTGKPPRKRAAPVGYVLATDDPKVLHWGGGLTILPVYCNLPGAAMLIYGLNLEPPAVILDIDGETFLAIRQTDQEVESFVKQVVSTLKTAILLENAPEVDVSVLPADPDGFDPYPDDLSTV